jgi:death-on-curing protein
MMANTLYLSLSEALYVQELLLQRHGGAAGIREPGLLEAALNRPQMGYYGDLIEEAAALFESLAINHCFIDGNKRVAFGVTDIFLRINGYKIADSSKGIYTEMMQLFDSNEFNFAHLERYLRKVVTKA